MPGTVMIPWGQTMAAIALASSTAFNSHGSEHIWHAPIYGHFERGNMEMMF
jgi:hypothetical protein